MKKVIVIVLGAVVVTGVSFGVANRFSPESDYQKQTVLFNEETAKTEMLVLEKDKANIKYQELLTIKEELNAVIDNKEGFLK